jgi:hypothetical protein
MHLWGIAVNNIYTLLGDLLNKIKLKLERQSSLRIDGAGPGSVECMANLQQAWSAAHFLH